MANLFQYEAIKMKALQLLSGLFILCFLPLVHAKEYDSIHKMAWEGLMSGQGKYIKFESQGEKRGSYIIIGCTDNSSMELISLDAPDLHDGQKIIWKLSQCTNENCNGAQQDLGTDQFIISNNKTTSIPYTYVFKMKSNFGPDCDPKKHRKILVH